MFYAIQPWEYFSNKFQKIDQLEVEHVLDSELVCDNDWGEPELFGTLPELNQIFVDETGTEIGRPPKLFRLMLPLEFLGKFGPGCVIEPGMRLAAGGTMHHKLYKYLYFVSKFTNSVGSRKRFSLGEVAAALDSLGVSSATGREVSASHVCNAIKDSVKRIGPSYTKSGYQGKNYLCFPHQDQPRKTFYSNTKKI